LLIELLFPLMTVWYYNFYVSGLPLGQAAKLLQPELHCQFAGHFVLFVLMTIATFIDFDEQSIPDYVTVSGTVLGLLGAAWAPAWLPFHANPLTELHANVPAAWPLWLNGAWGLGIGMTILLVWCFALLDRRWIVRRGLAKGVQYFFARMFRHPLLWKLLFVVTACLLMVVTAVWYFPFGSARWPYLLSSLLGLAFAGGVTWAVRLSATWGLRVEALGFGDVTLMAMIGTFVGWQPSLLIFFIAPLVSIVFVLVRWMLTGDAATPYGPYLCAATVVVLVYWDDLWNQWAGRLFELGPATIVGIVVACVVLMGAMLWIWRLIKEALGIAGH
jgi:prepilin signal peptidase PulO-like enzyme (type II secretory pathway)